MRLSTKLSLVFLPAVVTVMVGLLLVAADALDDMIMTTHHRQLGTLVQQLRQAELLEAGQVDRTAIARRMAELAVQPLSAPGRHQQFDPGTPEGALLVAWQEVMLRAGRHLTVLQTDGRVLMSTMPGGYDYEAFWRDELGGTGQPLVPQDARTSLRTGIAGLPGQAVPYAAGRHAALGWVVVVAVPRGEISAALAQLEWWILGIGLVLSAVLLVLGWALARRMILRPVEVLQGAAQDIAAFRPVGRIPLEGRDELADLARALESMARELATAFTALRREHDMNAVLMNSAPAAVAVLDAQGRILHCNGRFGQAFGPAAGRPIAAVVVGEADRPQAEAHFAAARAAAREFQLPGGPDSAVFAWTVAALPAALSVARGRDAAGQAPAIPAAPVPAFVATGIDVTERHRAEAQRRALEVRLEHQRRLETLGTFAGGVAHDLNNILTPVLGYARMAEDRAGGDPQTADYLGRIRKSADRARHLIQQILTFGRKVGPEKEVLDLVEIVAECLDLEVEEPQSRIAVHRDWAEGPDAPRPLVDADPVQLHQVLSNLVSNARHAMPEGGELRVAVTAEQVPGSDDRPSDDHPGGTWAVVRVSDTGTGMDEAVLAHVFEPFFTTRRGGRGTGLGLAVAHGIVNAHGGWIDVESRPGEGSRFSVYLPLAEAAEPSKPSEVAPMQAPAAGKPDLSGAGVLVVDDDAAVQLLAQRVLQAAGCRVVTASSGMAALQLLRAGSTPGGPAPMDLVLTDLVMPGMSGQDLAAAVAEGWPGLPLVAMTGGPGARAPERGSPQGGSSQGGSSQGGGAADGTDREGADPFAARLAKPFNPEDLLDLVRKVLAARRIRA